MAIGCLTYVTTIRRLDLADGVGFLPKFMPKPGKELWQSIERMLRYIQGALNYGLVFKADGTDPILTGYSDADLGGDVSMRGLPSGYVFQIQVNTISWCSRRQAFFARLTHEYIAMSIANQEAIWSSRLLSDIQIKQTDPSL